MRILLFDIENAPNLSYIWGQYEQNAIRHVHQGNMLSFAYKWLGDSRVHVKSLRDYPLYKKDKKDDKDLVKDLWKLFDEADVIIAHNGDQFDIKQSNKYFIRAGLTPPSPYKTIDTKKVAKRHFRFNSNKLTDLGEYLGEGRKIDTGGFELWEGCMAGDGKSWDLMEKYNKQDVVLLEKIYLRLRPWITAHPDMAFDGQCKNCGGEHLWKRGFIYQKLGKRERLQCKDCGAWNTGKLTRYEKLQKEA